MSIDYEEPSFEPNDVTLDMLDELKDADACIPARRWIRDWNFTSRQEAWNACERPDWMEWWINTCYENDFYTYNLFDDEEYHDREEYCNKIREYYPTVPERNKG